MHHFYFLVVDERDVDHYEESPDFHAAGGVRREGERQTDQTLWRRSHWLEMTSWVW